MIAPFSLLELARSAESGTGSDAAAVSPPMIIPAAEVPEILKELHPLIIAVNGIGPDPNVGGFLKGAILQLDSDWTHYSLSDRELNDLSFWSSLLGKIGVDGKRPVLVYDNYALKFASRIRFLLNHYGTDRAILINGGWRALVPLVKKGLLETEPKPAQPVAVDNTVRVLNSPIRLVFAGDVRRTLESRDSKLIDVRTCEEYIGEDVLPGIHRPGHIPGALNLPLQNLQTKDELLLSNAALRDVFAKFDIHNNMPLIFYCQDGARSSLAALAAVNAGYRAVNLYYQSYLGWQSDPNNPIVKSGSCPPAETV